MFCKVASLLIATVAVFSTFTAVNAQAGAGSARVQARAELFDAVANLIERSEVEDIDAREEMEAFYEVFNRAACPAGYYFDPVYNRCCSNRTRCKGTKPVH